MSDQNGKRLRELLALRHKCRSKDLAQVLTLIDELGPMVLKHKSLLEPDHQALRIGITGPPGAGKSTLIARLIAIFRARGLKVGVLAVDPSSPFSQGAILGDRIRYSDSFTDPGVFIRSIGSRGHSGGVTANAYLFLRAFDAWKFDVVLLETVGVGQTELEVMYVADEVAVVLVPEGGDSIQAMKAGLLEIADIFVVNKSDRPGSEGYARELEDTLALSEGKVVPVLLASAAENKGLQEFAEILLDPQRVAQALKRRRTAVRLQAEVRALLWLTQIKKIETRVRNIKTPADILKVVLR